MEESVPFRFLDLPKELRIIVYENLSVSTKQIRLLSSTSGDRLDQEGSRPIDSQPTITSTLNTLPVQILATCRLVHLEAFPFLSRKLNKISGTIPRIITDTDCLYTDALQKLMRTILVDLNENLFLGTNPPIVSSMVESEPTEYPKDMQQWLTQTTHLLLSQRPVACPFSGFMGSQTYPTVRLIVEVLQTWQYKTCDSLAIQSPTSLNAPPTNLPSITSQLSRFYSRLVSCIKELKYVKSGAIIFGQEGERELKVEASVVGRGVALDFGICRDIG